MIKPIVKIKTVVSDSVFLLRLVFWELPLEVLTETLRMKARLVSAAYLVLVSLIALGFKLSGLDWPLAIPIGIIVMALFLDGCLLITMFFGLENEKSIDD